MGKTKKISFSVGYIEGHKKALPHVDFWVTSIDNARKFKFQISEHLGDRGSDNPFITVEVGNAFGGLTAVTEYLMDTLNEPELFLISHDKGTNSFKLAELHNWLFAAIQGLLL